MKQCSTSMCRHDLAVCTPSTSRSGRKTCGNRSWPLCTPCRAHWPYVVASSSPSRRIRRPPRTPHSSSTRPRTIYSAPKASRRPVRAGDPAHSRGRNQVFNPRRPRNPRSPGKRRTQTMYRRPAHKAKTPKRRHPSRRSLPRTLDRPVTQIVHRADLVGFRQFNRSEFRSDRKQGTHHHRRRRRNRRRSRKSRSRR